MPDEMMDEMEFEAKVAAMNESDLLRFTAKQVYKINLRCEIHEKWVSRLQADIDKHTNDSDTHSKGLTKKQVGTTGGLSAIVGGAIVFVIDWLMRRNT